MTSYVVGRGGNPTGRVVLAWTELGGLRTHGHVGLGRLSVYRGP